MYHPNAMTTLKVHEYILRKSIFVRHADGSCTGHVWLCGRLQDMDVADDGLAGHLAHAERRIFIYLFIADDAGMIISWLHRCPEIVKGHDYISEPHADHQER